MKLKKNHVFTVRFDDVMNRVVRKVSFRYNVSSGSFIRRIVKAYLISKGYMQ